MKQIKDKPLPSSEIIGEFTLDDLCLFYPCGRASKLWLKWETVKRFARLLDDAHAREILSFDTILKKYETTELKSEDELRHLAELIPKNNLNISKWQRLNRSPLERLFEAYSRTQQSKLSARSGTAPT